MIFRVSKVWCPKLLCSSYNMLISPLVMVGWRPNSYCHLYSSRENFKELWCVASLENIQFCPILQWPWSSNQWFLFPGSLAVPLPGPKGELSKDLESAVSPIIPCSTLVSATGGRQIGKEKEEERRRRGRRRKAVPQKEEWRREDTRAWEFLTWGFG